MKRVRYTRWSGTQEPFGPDLSPDEVLAELADELLDGTDPQAALDDLLRRGIDGRVAGLDQLRRRLADARRAELGRMGLEAPLQHVAERLAEVLDLERTALQFEEDADLAAERAAALDLLPSDLPGKLAALERYAWVDGGAEQAFRELLDDVRRDVAEATFGDLAQALRDLDPKQVARTRAMLVDLNDLVERRERGDDVTEAFAAFQERHGDLLPRTYDDLDDLLEDLARRMSAMSRMMAGLSPDQRAELAALAQQALGDLGLQFQAGQLASALHRLHPGMGWGQPPRGAMPTGAESGSMADTVGWVEHLQSYEDLATALGQDYAGARLEDVDEDALRQALGDDAVRDLRALREIERLLERSGAVRREQGRLELTPRGVRRLGEQSLQRIFDRALSRGLGDHRSSAFGGDAEITGATRPLRFGDPFRVDVNATVRNAILRSAGGGVDRGVRHASNRAGDRGGAAAVGVRLDAEDFALAEAERRVKACTVLLLDMSFSMPLRGNWDAAKRLALALQSLVASRFPQDRFYIVGFSDYARRLEPKDLLVSGWERVWGTNMQHAFALARRLLSAHPGTEQQVIVVTDGEPTAHLEGAESIFSWPPHPQTLRATMAEALRLARSGAALNVFLLDHDPGAARFVEAMVSRCGGRIFHPDLSDLGSVVVQDFLQRRG